MNVYLCHILDFTGHGSRWTMMSGRWDECIRHKGRCEESQSGPLAVLVVGHSERNSITKTGVREVWKGGRSTVVMRG
jgi:hypothetical protein